MKKLFLSLILFLVLIGTSHAQGPYKVYLPMVLSNLTNGWQIVKPIATTNYILNPSAETTGNFAAIGSATITRSTTYQKYSLNSYRIQTVAGNTGLSLTTQALTNATHWMTARIRATRFPPELRFAIGNSNQEARLIEKIDDHWDLYGAQFDAAAANGRTAANIIQVGVGSGDIYVDGIQIEPLGDWTTYCDGTQEGCAWNGAEHASSSFRSLEYSGGGTPQDLYQEYRFFVTKIVGAGASNQELNVDSYALLPGGELNSVKVQSRQFTIIGKFITNSEKELHDMRQELIKTLKTANSGQPLSLRFNGGRVQKEIRVLYQGGLEGDLAAFYDNFEPMEDNQWGETKQFIEKAAIQFLAPDPYWYEVGESATSLENASDDVLYTEEDTNDSATFRLVAARLRSTGQWDALGPPNVAGTYTNVRAFTEDATYIYIGGDFLNFDNIADADRIVRYNKQTGVYSAMGTGANGVVRALAVMPNGDVIAAGAFTSMGGVANTTHVARWDILSETWKAMATGLFPTGSVLALVVGQTGLIYGAGEEGGDGLVSSWNGASWSLIGTFSNICTALAVGPNGRVYVVGGESGLGFLQSWDGSTWTAIFSTATVGGVSVGPVVSAVAVSPAGLVYAAGSFTTIGGVAYNRIVAWNGTALVALGSGVNGAILALAVGQDNMLYISGFFSTAGGINIADRVTRWNGYTYAHLDIDLPGLATVYAILASKHVDPVIKQKYNLFLGFDTTGTGNFAGKFVVTNDGNVPAFPEIIYFRSGGTSAIIETLKNERTGKELLFDYGLLSGETLTIDLVPTQKSIESSFFGSRLDAVLANSDFGTWQLLPEENDVTTFVVVSGGPQLTAYMLWRDVYDSWD